MKNCTAKIQSMKKAVPKGDKKRKKDVAAETARLEQELQDKHTQELKSVETNGISVAAGAGERVGEVVAGEWGRGKEDEDGWKTVSDDDKPVKKSRAQRRKVFNHPRTPPPPPPPTTTTMLFYLSLSPLSL